MMLQASAQAQAARDMMHMIEEQQSTLAEKVAVSEQRLKQTQLQFGQADGASRTAARVEVIRAESQLSEARQQLNMARDRYADLQREIAMGTMGDGPSTGVAMVQPHWRVFGLTPSEFFGGGGFILLFPLVLALSRRIWRGGGRRASGATSLDGDPHIARLEQAVDAIAIEVERISEAQRFSAKLLSERVVQPASEDASPRRAKRPVITPLP